MPLLHRAEGPSVEPHLALTQSLCSAASCSPILWQTPTTSRKFSHSCEKPIRLFRPENFPLNQREKNRAIFPTLEIEKVERCWIDAIKGPFGAISKIVNKEYYNPLRSSVRPKYNMIVSVPLNKQTKSTLMAIV